MRAAPLERTLLAILVLAAVAAGCALSLFTTLLAVRLHAAGFSGHAIGWNTAAAGFATLASAPFVPRAARRLGVARLLAASLLVGGAVMLLFMLTSSFAVWLILRCAEGMCATAMFVLTEFWIASRAGDRRRGRVIALYVTSLAFGFALGPQVLSLAGTTGGRPFLAGGLLLASLALPVLFAAGAAPDLEERGSRPSLLRCVREAPAAACAALLHGAIEIAGLTFLPVYALLAGKGLATGAAFASLFVAGSCALQIPIGILADRFDRTRLLAGLSVAGIAGAIALALLGTAHRVIFVGLLVVWGGLVGAFYPVGLGEIGRRYTGTDLAGANAAFVMLYALGMLLGPPIVGEGLDLLPPSGLFWAMAALIGLYLALVVAGPARRRAPPAAARS